MKLGKRISAAKAATCGGAGEKRRIIGIDPGIASTGWGVIDLSDGKVTHIGHGHIQTKAAFPRAARLLYIMEEIRSVLAAHTPDEAAMEALFFGKNVSSALSVAEARGVIFAAMAERGLSVREFAPNTVKATATGLSRVGKSQVQQMVRVILNLQEIPRPDHAADALGVAVCAALSAGGGQGV